MIPGFLIFLGKKLNKRFLKKIKKRGTPFATPDLAAACLNHNNFNPPQQTKTYHAKAVMSERSIDDQPTIVSVK